MNEYAFGTILEKNSKPMVDFEYNVPKNKNKRRSVFQIFTPKANPKKVLNNNPKELVNATNKINFILSKNLKSIYNENKNDISEDNPIYDNVNCLIKKNNYKNRDLYNKIINFKNQLNDNKYQRKESYNTFISTNSGKDFRDSTIISKIDKLKNNNLFRTSIKNSGNLRKQLDSLQKKKVDVLFGSNKVDTRLSIRKKEKKNFGPKKRNSSLLNNFKFNLPNSKNKENGEELAHLKKKIYKGNSITTMRHNSILFSPKNKNKNNNFILSKKKDKKSLFQPNINIIPNQGKKRYSLKMVNDNRFKKDSDLKELKESRNRSWLNDSSNNMQIPTLRQINSAIAKTLLENSVEKVRKQIDGDNNNEISETINNLPKNKSEKKIIHSLIKNRLNPNNEIDKSETKELLKDTLPLKEQIEYQRALEEDRFQKKYRKLYLNKNLYDSVDDEEVVDEEKIYRFYISTNSITVYILDFIILISSFIELYYLPIYLSLHISSYSIYYDVISSFIFYFIDFFYIVDLITGFFRAYHNFDEILIKNNIDMCVNYLWGWFIFDLIEAIPFFTLLDRNMKKIRRDFLSSNNNANHLYDFGLNNKYYALTVIKLLKIFKTFSSNRALQEFTKFCEKSQFIYEWKGLFSTLLITFSSLHFCTCFFIYVGKNEAGGWIIRNNLEDKNFWDIYISSLYYQMTTLTTVGYGDISVTNSFERIYGIFILIIGTCAYSWILTFISNYIKKNNEKYIDYEKKMNVLSEIKLEYPNLGQGLYEQIIRYLNYTKSENKINLKYILESLPLSLQNNLIIEIYKPIIQNFQFFKSFENSDFFVKIVTSLKPILSMKDDILIQEGDIIEDIIFIKNGVLTLEIIIDLNDPKKSVESHLEMTRMECFKTISNRKLTSLFNLTTLNPEYNTNFGKQIFSNKISKKKEIKIIDLRRNEHYGDILMILNEKSPLTVKVKSKKAELFFLQKTEATEISNRYSNIWKRIVNRSLHNMKQIKNLIRKKIFLFIQTYSIEIDPSLKEKYLKNGANTNLIEFSPTLKKDIKISENVTIIGEENYSLKNKMHISDKNIRQSKKTRTQSNKMSKVIDNKNRKNNQIQPNIQKEINTSDSDSDSDKDVSNEGKLIEKNYKKNKSFDKENKTSSKKNEKDNPLKNTKKNQSFNEVTKIIEINNINNDINNVNDMMHIIDDKVKKTNDNIKNQINNFNIINIYTQKVQIPLSKINIENKSSNKFFKEEKNDIDNSGSLGKVNNEISYDNDFMQDIKDNDILMDNYDENNNMFYSNQKFMDSKINKNSIINDNNNSNIIKLFERRRNEKRFNKKNINEKTDIKTNDKTSIRSLSSDKCNINFKSQLEIHNDKNHKFISLNTSKSISFSITSSYDNINKISNYKYQNSSDLREKTKQFILEQINDEKVDNTSNKKINKNLLNINYAMKPSVKKILRKKSENLESRMNISKIDNINNVNPIKKPLLKNTKVKFDSHIHSPKKFDVSFSQDVEDNKKDAKKFHSTIHSARKRYSFKKKTTKRQESIEKTFYNKINRMKTMRKRNAIDFFGCKSENEENNVKVNYEQLISKNIENNQQNLNNPVEYFEEFFNDILFKKNRNISILEGRGLKRKKTFEK